MIADSNNPVEYPIDGTLDLHQFLPNETKEVVNEFIAECLKRDILAIRIVHGKGIGVQREVVRSVLALHPNVVSFRHESGSGGGWGATVADLKK